MNLTIAFYLQVYQQLALILMRSNQTQNNDLVGNLEELGLSKYESSAYLTFDPERISCSERDCLL